MGKALAVQSARLSNVNLAGTFGGARAYHSKVSRNNIHTSTDKKARAIDVEMLRHDPGVY